MRTTREFKLLLTIPGVGKISAAILAAIIDDPERFEDKRSLWKYSSLSVRRRCSGDPGRAKESASPSGNRLMKYAAMTAANSAIRGDNRFSRHYRKMLEEGIDPAMAKKTVARKILATALAILKSGECYRDDAGKSSAVSE
ncbi:MAG: transposase [bacterium]